jgi:hypothetical protein
MGNRSTARLLFWTFLALYLASAGGRLYVNDSYVKLLTARALWENGNLAIPPQGKLSAISPKDGRTYAKFEVLHSLLYLPAVAGGEALVRTGLVSPEKRGHADAALASLLGPVSAAVTVLFFYLWARLLFRQGSGPLRAALVLGAATMLWPYAKRCWTEAPQAALLVAGCFAVSLARSRGSGRVAFVGGVLLGGAVALRVTGVILLPILALPLIEGRALPGWGRRLTLFLLGAAAPVFPLVLGANWVRFGSPLSLFVWRMEGFTTPFWSGLVGLVASPGESIFLYSPVLIAGALLLPGLRRVDRATCAAAGLAPAALIVLYASWWFHAYTWGPRFLLPAVPFLALPLARPEAWGGRMRPFLATLVVLSLGLQILGVLFHVGDLAELEKPLVRHGFLRADRSLTREETWFHPLHTRPVSHLLVAGEGIAALARGRPAPVAPDLWPLALRDTFGVPLRFTAPLEAGLLLLAACGTVVLIRRARGEPPQGSGSV